MSTGSISLCGEAALVSPSDALEYEIGDGKMIFIATGHQYLVASAPYRRQRVSLTDANGTILHVDQFDVSSDVARQRFLKSAGDSLNGRAADVRRELKLIAANIDTIIPQRQRTAASYVDNNPYSVNESGVFYERVIPNSHEPIETQLSNFGARITQDIQINDGHEDRREFRIDAWQGSIRRTLTMSAKRFESLDWASDDIGAGAVVFPGPSANQHVVAAIKLDSEPEKRSVYGHTGWRELDDGAMGYLTASGAITGDGLRSGVGVLLESPLDLYVLPEPPAGIDLTDSVRIWLGMLDVAGHAATIPVFCALLRSVIRPSDFVMFIKGGTGQGKSQLAGLIQASFGPAFNGSNLPANFTSTANALEMLANLTKDAVLVIDDFQRNASDNVEAKAERIGRAVGNQSGRARLNREIKLQKQRPPRGTVVMTGEDTPRGESLRARMSIVELPRGSMIWDSLKIAQKHAKDGRYASALAGFVQWIAIDYDARQADYDARFDQLRDLFQSENVAHHKTTQTVAQLHAAFTLFLDFAESCQAIDAQALTALTDETERILRDLITAQAAHLGAVDPVLQFLSALESAITSGTAYLANRHGEPPRDNPEAWGWQRSGEDWRARGQQAGWIADDGIYLDFGAAFKLVQQGMMSAGAALPLTEQTLLKRLEERGFLLSKDAARQTYKIRRDLQGRTRNVVHLRFPVDVADEEQTNLFGGDDDA